MKQRDGFVTNSSSANFVCSYCGHEESGYDWDPVATYGFRSCANNHLVCESHLSEEVLALLQAKAAISSDNLLTEEQCPACQGGEKYCGGIIGTGHNFYPEDSEDEKA